MNNKNEIYVHDGDLIIRHIDRYELNGSNLSFETDAFFGSQLMDKYWEQKGYSMRIYADLTAYDNEQNLITVQECLGDYKLKSINYSTDKNIISIHFIEAL